MKKNFDVVKSSILLSLSSFLGPASNFLLLPIYASKLSPDDYGITSILTSVQSILVIFSGLLVSSSINVNFSQLDFREFKRFFSSTLLFKIVLGSFVFACLCLKGDTFLKLVVSSRKVEFYNVGLYISLTVLMNSIVSHFSAAIFIEGRIWLFNIVTWLSLIISMSCSVLFVYILNYGYEGIFLSSMISSLIQMAVLGFSGKHLLTRNLKRCYIKASLQYSLPLVPHKIGVFLYALSDRFILERDLAVAAVGIYAMSDKFANISKLIVKSTNQSLQPHFFSLIKRFNEKRAYESYRDYTSKWYLANSLVAVLIAVYSEEAIELLTPNDYHEAWFFVAPLCFAYLITGLSGILFLGLSAEYKTKSIGIISIFCGLVNIILNIYFIPRWGVLAAVGSTLASAILSAIISIAVSVRHKLIQPDLPCIAEITICSTVLISLASQVEFNFLIWEVVLKSVMIVIMIMYYIFRDIGKLQTDFLFKNSRVNKLKFSLK